MRINVRQTTDTEWEILSATSVDPEDLTVTGTVNITGPTSAQGSSGTEHFRGITPGNVVGQIIDYLSDRLAEDRRLMPSSASAADRTTGRPSENAQVGPSRPRPSFADDGTGRTRTTV